MAHFLQPSVEYQEHFSYKAGSSVDKHTYTFIGKCVISGKDVSVTVGGKDLFKYHQGTLMQEAFPYLTAQEREWMITGIYDWDDLYDKIKEEEEYDVDVDENGPFIVAVTKNEWKNHKEEEE